MKKIEFTDDLKALLYFRFKDAETRQLEQLKHTAYNFLTLAQMRIFSLMIGQEMIGRKVTISDLAKWMNISRQAVQKTVSTLASHGLLELVESPINRSAKLINLTVDGQKLWTTIKKVNEKLESDLVNRIGKKRLVLLKEILMEDWG